MSKFNNKKSMPRYSFIAILMALLALIVQAKTLYIMTAEHDFWTQVADRVKKDSIVSDPVRGNILSCDGQIMASSLPRFKLFIDFNAIHNANNDSLFEVKLDSIAEGLSIIFPEKSAAEFKEHLLEGYHKKKKGNWPIWKKLVNYSTKCEVEKLPILNLSPYKGGFKAEKFDARQFPFGSLAQRTIGKMFAKVDSAQCGIELYYDSLLRGEKGIKHRRKVLSRYLDIDDTPPVNGMDIVTTIDVSMQDLAERALLKELNLIGATVGVAIVMEVKTGDVKAMVNMSRLEDGSYAEIQNHAVSDLLEPGSVFKTASIMVALDDGVVDTTYKVDTGCGVWPMYKREMKDHNWRRGGYGMLTLPQTLWVSSNIGVSRIIDDHYHSCPEKFVEGIYRLGLHDDLGIPLGAARPRIRMPKKDSKGKQYLNWSDTALPWMSIGYETQIPPISTLTFYNAIANGGKMMQPRFVKSIMVDGKVVEQREPVVLRERIAKESTIKQITTILEQVVRLGLGKKAGSESFLVAGKTGTAQISKGAAGYKSGEMKYLLSFAGFFPAYEPQYSCIVCIQKSGLPASGGGMSGVVFHDIAEGIMAQSVKRMATDARDHNSVLTPDVKCGNILAADYVLNQLGLKPNVDWDETHPTNAPIWGYAENNGKSIALRKADQTPRNVMPNVHGMGARDAVYLLEGYGLKVIIKGRGKVVEQSIGAGDKVKRGMTCSLRLA